MSFYVYHYCEPKSGTPFYVGKGKGRRAYVHLNNCNRLCDSSYNTLFYRKLRKMLLMGIDPDIKIVKDRLEEKEAFDLEEADIKHIGRRNLGNGPLTNLTNGGDGTSGYKHSKETRQKLREKQLGNQPSTETCQKISKALSGGKRSKETKQRMSNAQKGRIFTKETKQRMSIAKRGVPLFARRGIKHTKEARQKMSKNSFRRPVNGFDESGKMVWQFDSIKTAAESGFSCDCISHCLAGRAKTHKGLYWRYSDA